MSPVKKRRIAGVNVTCNVCGGTGRNPDVNNPNLPVDSGGAGDDAGRCPNCQGTGTIRVPARYETTGPADPR